MDFNAKAAEQVAYTAYAPPKTPVMRTGEARSSRRWNVLRNVSAALNLLQAALVCLLFFPDYTHELDEPLWFVALALPGAVNLIALWMLSEQKWMNLLGALLNLAWILVVLYWTLPRTRVWTLGMLPLAIGAGPQLLAMMTQIRMLAMAPDDHDETAAD